MISKNKEKKFSILAVASMTENYLLADVDEILELCTFITGENITMSNISEKSHTVRKLIYEQYPDLINILTTPIENKLLIIEHEDILKKFIQEGKDPSTLSPNLKAEYDYYYSICKIKKMYIDQYGEKVIIKSIKKEIIKELKLTR